MSQLATTAKRVKRIIECSDKTQNETSRIVPWSGMVWNECAGRRPRSRRVGVTLPAVAAGALLSCAAKAEPRAI